MDPSMAFNTGLILLAAMALLFLVLLVGKAPFRILGRVFGFLRLPFRVLAKMLRAIGILRRAPGRSLSHSAVVGASGVALFTHLWEETETDQALAVSDTLPAEGAPATAHDYAAERQGLEYAGRLFQSIKIQPAYMPDTSGMDDAIAEKYFKQGTAFFSQQVPIDSNTSAFYEDVEGAVVIGMFRARDRRFYYLANEMRKIINSNVKNLCLAFSVIISAFVLIELLLTPADVIDFMAMFGGGAWTAVTVLGQEIPRTLMNSLVLDVVLLAVSGGTMLILYSAVYGRAQERNNEQLRGFLNRYLARLSDRYRQSIANARAVTVGDERDAQKAAATAQRWHKVVLWLSFRVFFIETYLRNVLYQINRNSGYYIVGIPLVFGIVLITAILLLSAAADFALARVFSAASPIFYISLVVLGWLYWRLITGSMHDIAELDQHDWLGFDNLNVSQAMDQIVGGYVEEIVHLKNRVRGGGAG